MIWGIVVLAVLLLIAFLYMRRLERRVRHQTDIAARYAEVINQKKSAIDTLFAQLSNESQSGKTWHARVIQLENAIEKSFGVTVRREVTEVKTDFTKLEWVVMLSGVHKLLDGSKIPEDAKVYLEILDKIQAFIDDLKEEMGEAHGV